MKTRFLFFTLLMFCTSVFSQQLTVTPDGLRDTKDNTKTYVIIESDGLTAQQLYENAIKYINKAYKNPSEVIKGKTEGEYLKFVTHVPSFLYAKNSGVKVLFDANYTTELSFKDGKTKYEIIELDAYTQNDLKPLVYSGSGLTWYIFNDKKGTLKREEVKTQIEDYFKGQINALKEALTGNNNEDDW